MLKKLGFKWRLVERWTEEECTQFEQNVIEHGWGNWKNMSIPSRSNVQIKNHATGVKKDQPLIWEHAKRTADIRTYFLPH